MSDKVSAAAKLAEELLTDCDYYMTSGEKPPQSFYRQVRSRLSLAAQQNERLLQAWQILTRLDDALQKEGHIWNGPIRHRILKARDLIAAVPMPKQEG